MVKLTMGDELVKVFVETIRVVDDRGQAQPTDTGVTLEFSRPTTDEEVMPYLVVEGWALLAPSDRYNRSYGRRLAFGRALHAARTSGVDTLNDRHVRAELWRQFRDQVRVG